MVEPAAAAAQSAGRMRPTGVHGMTAGTAAAIGHGRAQFLNEDVQLRRTGLELAVLQLAHQVLLERPAARTLGQLIDQLRQLSVQCLDCLENTQGSESSCGYRGQQNAEAARRRSTRGLSRRADRSFSCRRRAARRRSAHLIYRCAASNLARAHLASDAI